MFPAEAAAPESGMGGPVSTAEGGGFARPLAPPEVGPLHSEEEEEEDVEEESDDDDDCGESDEGLAEAVENLLREVEAFRKDDSFPALEALSTIDKTGPYLGPTMESNWVLPGRLLVGAYPASLNDSHHAHLLCTILLQGVSTFVCLQQEYRADPGVTEAMWRSGEALRPYFQDVQQLLGKLGELRRADPQSVPPVCAPEDTDFVHFPIVDCNVADDTKVLQLAARLAARLAQGEVMYLHCWGGHGRTGTVVCIMLHLMYGLSADEAMERCQHVHDVRRIPISVGSPQTEAQRKQVRRVIEYVIAHRKSLPPSPPQPQPQPRSQQQLNEEEQQEAEQQVSSAFGSGNGSSRGGGLTPESGKKGGAGGTGSSRAAAVGGRRAWVRGRRRAFAQAPNGIGEDVSGWLPDESGGGGDDDVDDAGQQQPQNGGIVGAGSDLAGVDRSRRASRTASVGTLSAVGDAAGKSVCAGAGTEAAGSSAIPRRKSFSEPYSDEDPSRGMRMSGLRRKSAPGKPPADVIFAYAAAAGGCARVDAPATAGSGATSRAGGCLSGQEDCSNGSASGGVGGGRSLSLSPANRNSCHLPSKTCASSGGGGGGVTGEASPGSCTGVERYMTRSSGLRAAGAAHPPSPSMCVTR